MLGRLTASVLLLLSAGCVTPFALQDAAPAMTTHPFAFDGRIEQLVCARTDAQNACHVTEGSVDLHLDGAVQQVQAEFTWESQGPVDEELQAYLLQVDEDGDWFWHDTPNAFARGTSPLTVDWVVDDLGFTPAYVSLHMASGHRAEAGELRFVAGSGAAWHVGGEAKVAAAHALR